MTPADWVTAGFYGAVGVGLAVGLAFFIVAGVLIAVGFVWGVVSELLWQRRNRR